MADLVEKGFLTERTCLTAAGSLLPNFKNSVSNLLLLLLFVSVD